MTPTVCIVKASWKKNWVRGYTAQEDRPENSVSKGTSLKPMGKCNENATAEKEK